MPVVITTLEAMTPEAIKRLRKSLGLTQEQFASAIGANRVTIADWELGSHKPRGLYLAALNALAAKAKRNHQKKSIEKHRR
jgi:DNA-binding transcriptional regulator YiaG